ncbi:hypothetical protein ACM66B_005070 [Microbotryomycetes sp. NB124-2]
MTRPRVGVAVFVVRHQQLVIGIRKGSHGPGTVQLPGGHLEQGESWQDCATREVLEETGLQLNPESIGFVTATNDVFNHDKHYVTVFMIAEPLDKEAEPRVLEPEKCESWQWTSLTSLRSRLQANEGPDLFLPLRHCLESRFDALIQALSGYPY